MMLLFASLLLGTAGTTYNDTISEVITSADSYASTAIYAGAITESFTATDSEVSGGPQSYSDVLGEGVTLADALGSVYYPTTAVPLGWHPVIASKIIWGPLDT